MPLWSFDLKTVGMAAQGSCAIYSVMAMLKIGPVQDFWEARKFIAYVVSVGAYTQ